MKPRTVPKMLTDEEAEAFLEQDLSALDYSVFRPAGWEPEPTARRDDKGVGRARSPAARH